MNDEIRQVLIALAEKNSGLLTPEEVVKSATPKASPLHAMFEWDDRVAASEHRIATARSLIRQVRVEIVTTELTAPARVPFFARNTRDGGYATLSWLNQDSDLAREAAVLEFQKAAAALRRAQQVAIALNLGAEAVATVAALIRNVQTAERDFPKL